MAKRSRSDQLDLAVEALLAGPDAGLPRTEAALAPLVALAAGLRGLPREEFRARLGAELERTATMSSKPRRARRGSQTVTPYLVVDRPVQFLEFLKQAFGAEERLRTKGSAGGLHAELRIGDATIMAGGGQGIAPIPAALHLYVPDADAVYHRALAAGAASVYEPGEKPYGDREAGVKDPSGNYWYIGTHRGARWVPEGMRSVTPVLHPRGADELMEFLQRAFGAEEVATHRSPQGAVIHATVRIGDSMVELGEAHIEPLPCMLLLLVDDVDAAYQRALAAGATPLEPPADQPYGARRAGVKDPWDNSWYVSAPLGRSRP